MTFNEFNSIFFFYSRNFHIEKIYVIFEFKVITLIIIELLLLMTLKSHNNC